MSDLTPILKVGDLVQFKSGGPAMAVLDIKATVKCGWFTEGRYYDAHFPVECLERYQAVKYNITYTPYEAPGRIVPLGGYSDVYGGRNDEST